MPSGKPEFKPEWGATPEAGIEAIERGKEDVESNPPHDKESCTFGIAAVSIPEVWAPGHDTVEIQYNLYGNVTKVSAAVVNARGEEHALPNRCELPCGEGQESCRWNGEFDGDGYADVDGSPYTLTLTVEGDGNPGVTQGEAQFSVKIADLELELAPEASWPDGALNNSALADLDRAGGLPAENETARLSLASNRFYMHGGQKDREDPTSFTTHAAAWGDGPVVPVVVRARIQALEGEPVVPKSPIGVQLKLEIAGAPIPFESARDPVSAYLARFTKAGENCPTVQSDAHESAALSPGGSPAATVHTDAETGEATFNVRLSRFGGDGYVLTAAAGEVKQSTGRIEVWRRIDILRTYLKQASLTALDYEATQKFFDPAFVELRVSRSPEVIPDTYYEQLSIAFDDDEKDFSVADPQTQENSAAAVAINRVGQSVDAEISEDTESDVRAAATKATEAIVDSLGKEEGVVVFQFGGATDQGAPGGRGFTPDGPGNDEVRSIAGQIQFGVPGDQLASGEREATAAHEIGHLLFLPHTMAEAKRATDATLARSANSHDSNDTACLMGYNFRASRTFCGLCLLRLRGWDGRELSPHAESQPELSLELDRDTVEGAPDKDPAPLVVTITNTGDASLVLHKIAVQRPFRIAESDKDLLRFREVGSEKNRASLVRDEPLVRGKAVSFEVTYQRGNTGHRAVTGKLTIYSNAAMIATEVDLKYTGFPKLHVTDDGFPDTRVDDESSCEVTLKNIGAQPLTIEAMSVSPPLRLGRQEPQTLEAEGSVTVVVTWKPSKAGEPPGSLTVTTQELADISVELSGEALERAAAKEAKLRVRITGQDPCASEAQMLVARSRAGSPITVCNSGTGQLDGRVALTGPFTLKGDTTKFDVLPEGDERFVVLADPNADIGAKGTLTLKTNDPTQPVFTLALKKK